MREHNSLPVRSNSHGLRSITRYGYQEESGDSKKAEDIARDNDVSAYINSHIFRDHSGYGKKGEEMVEFQRNLNDRCDSQESGSDNSCNNYTDNDNNDDGDNDNDDNNDNNDDVECKDEEQRNEIDHYGSLIHSKGSEYEKVGTKENRNEMGEKEITQREAQDERSGMNKISRNLLINTDKAECSEILIKKQKEKSFNEGAGTGESKSEEERDWNGACQNNREGIGEREREREGKMDRDDCKEREWGRDKSQESERNGDRNPLIVFKERWRQKELRIKSSSPVGHLR